MLFEKLIGSAAVILAVGLAAAAGSNVIHEITAVAFFWSRHISATADWSN